MLLKKKLDAQMLIQLKGQIEDVFPRLSDNPVCDFCGSEKPTVVYASTRMSTGEQRACWRWLACEQCDDAIAHAHWYRLRDRVVDRLKTMLPGTTPDHIMRRTVERVLLEFHITAVHVPEDK